MRVRAADEATPLDIDAPSVALSRAHVLRVSPPLRGTNWWTPNAPSNVSTHRRTVVARDGRVWAPERYAVDRVRLGPNGSAFTGDPGKNTSYFAYGTEAWRGAGDRRRRGRPAARAA